MRHRPSGPGFLALVAVLASAVLASAGSWDVRGSSSGSTATSRPQLRRHEAALRPGAFDASVREEISVVADPGEGMLWAVPLGTRGALADAAYVDSDNAPSNMGHFEVVTHAGVADELQLRAAGWAEGYLTALRIGQHHSNMWTFFNFRDPGPLRFLYRQRDWFTAQLGNASTLGQPYWDALRGVWAQFGGLVEGYNARVTHERAQARAQGLDPSPWRPLTADQLYFLCSMADLADITAALAYKSPRGPARHMGGMPLAPDEPDWDTLDPHDIAMELGSADRCSALIKVAPDLSDLWVGQVAWYTYAAMLRIFKHYSMALSNPGLPGTHMGFSSYPGQLSSDDDFYLVSPTNLTILQTTNHIFNASLLALIQPESVLAWQRVRAASLVARTGQQWADAVATHNSGTYTNSWAVLAHGQFSPGHALPPGLLTVVEQVPGRMYVADKTELLENGGHFALFNVPALREAYDALGYPQFLAHMAKRGPAYAEGAAGASRQLAPRAKLFRRDHHSVTCVRSMRDLMRSNNWQADPYSQNVSVNAICGRGDVDPKSPRAAGCYDGKVSDWRMALSLQADVVNGPPSSAQAWAGLPPFAWGPPWAAQVPHTGQPLRFEFEWERLSRTVTLPQSDSGQGSRPTGVQ